VGSVGSMGTMGSAIGAGSAKAVGGMGVGARGGLLCKSSAAAAGGVGASGMAESIAGWVKVTGVMGWMRSVLI
jgi:hypothetical protein